MFDKYSDGFIFIRYGEYGKIEKEIRNNLQRLNKFCSSDDSEMCQKIKNKSFFKSINTNTENIRSMDGKLSY